MLHDLAIVHGVVARLDWVPQAWMTSRSSPGRRVRSAAHEDVVRPRVRTRERPMVAMDFGTMQAHRGLQNSG